MRLKDCKWIPAPKSEKFAIEWLVCGEKILGSYWGTEPPFNAWRGGASAGEYLTAIAAKEAVEHSLGLR